MAVNCANAHGVYELPGHGYSSLVHDGDKRPIPRVETLSRDAWRVTLDVAVEEYYQNGEQLSI